MPTKGLAPGQRRRDRDARATLRRIEYQRAALATRYAQAPGPLARLVVVVTALRAAASPGAHQVEQAAVNRLLTSVTNAAREAVDDLHRRQQRRAEQTLATETERRTRRDQHPGRARRRTAA